MKIHEARLRQHIYIGSWRSTGTTDITGENCLIIEVKRTTQQKLEIICRHIKNNNEQAQTIKTTTVHGKRIFDFLEKNKSFLVGKKMSDFYNLTIE